MSAPPIPHIAAYVRVSTAAQTLDAQLDPLHAYAQRPVHKTQVALAYDPELKDARTSEWLASRDKRTTCVM